MRLLVDVNIEEVMVQWLVREGHDVLRAADVNARAQDVELLSIAADTSRIVITRDKDFGELIYRDRRRASGVVLIRLRARNQTERLALFIMFWKQIESSSSGNMVVVTNEHLRIRPLLEDI